MQALYITAKSDTGRAALVTIQMVELFDAVTSGKALPAPATGPLLPTPTPSRIGPPLSDLSFNERSLIPASRDRPPERGEQLFGPIAAAGTYTESLRGLWTATSACGMWDGIAAMIASHAHKFHQRIPI
ncbi:hypothetical protein A6A40_03670 [Azospirillum humicireducens]|uniref:Uncharacterized protein n=1 Tax=Azospirillum humicireducens TaxID=1226968 RepID=A0A168Y2A0_9PROT|nr:hypothetical protein [Azospirillum humicireducens]ANC91071.1 hypothetical protein A6A40_03670 [Azospirillum humicireducens]